MKPVVRPTSVALVSTYMFSRNPNILWTELSGRLVFMNLENGRYYEADGIGGVIWGLLEAARAECDIVDCIVAQYRIGRGECATDVGQFLAKLVSAGLIFQEISGDGGGAGNPHQ